MEDRCLLSAYTLTDLGTLDGAPDIQVTGLNNLGQVVGYATETSGQYVGFLWSNEQMTSLGSVGSNDSGSINGINDSTQVVGESGGAFLWSDGTRTSLEGLSYAIAINDSGEVAGVTANGEAALYQNGTITDLTPTSSFGQATAINTNGRVAGFFGRRRRPRLRRLPLEPRQRPAKPGCPPQRPG